MPKHYYIDTDYLHSYIFMKNHVLKNFLSKKNMDDEIVRCNHFRDIIFNRNKEFFIKIPFAVLGELFNNVNNHYSTFDGNCISSINNEVFYLFDQDNVDLIPPVKECYSLANEILQKDSRFDSTDALIVTQALIDKNSIFMATMDYTITESFGGGIIAEINDRLYCNSERSKKLKIYG